jgi:hypothetical protein
MTQLQNLQQAPIDGGRAPERPPATAMTVLADENRFVADDLIDGGPAPANQSAAAAAESDNSSDAGAAPIGPVAAGSVATGQDDGRAMDAGAAPVADNTK